jgi:DNA repair exonuclease SbcCD ATPase subunit
MGLFDGLVKGITDIIPDQGNPELKAYKAQNELKDLAEKENKIFARLGKQMYADNGAELYPDIKAELDVLAASRREVEERIKAAQDEAEAKKKTDARCCPECGTEYAEGAAFCQSCGHRLSPAKRFCPQCGAEVAQGGRFCNECGTKMEQ